MNTDIRIQLSFYGHLKRRKLQQDLGCEGVCALIDLWLYAAENRSNGDLTGMTNEDIALAANYHQNADNFIAGLCRAGFLDETVNPNGIILRRLHNWTLHNAWAANADRRSEHARELAQKRWNRKLSKKSTKNAGRMRDAMPAACETQCGAHTLGNAPLPNPLPSPKPSQKDYLPWNDITKNDFQDAKRIFQDKDSLNEKKD